MSERRKPLQPVKPTGMEIIYFYPCPFCQRQVPLISPTQPSLAACDACHANFPIVPVDDRTVQFIKTVLANGKASINPDFL